jgi:hypothetical protein
VRSHIPRSLSSPVLLHNGFVTGACTYLPTNAIDGCPVAQLAAAAAKEWSDRIDSVEKVRVVCMLTRHAGDCKDPEFLTRLQAQSWEIPICEVTVSGQVRPERRPEPPGAAARW